MKVSQEKIKIIKELEDLLQIPLYLVGGAVRDILLGLEPKDWDFATPIDPEEVEESVKRSGNKPYLIGKKFGTIGLKFEGKYIEITTFRSETYSPKNRKPEVEFVSDISQDLARRDFTINAMAIKSNGVVIDNWGGVEDLQKGVIRSVGNPSTRFKEDPLRILRAIRLATVFNFSIEQKTLEKIQSNRFRLFDISKERWVMELDKILADENALVGLNLLMDNGIFGLLIPELSLQKDYNQDSPYHKLNLWEHTKKVVNAVPKESLDLRWTALLHDIAKPFVRTVNKRGYSNYIGHEILGAQMALKICNYFKFSNARTDYIVNNIENHLSPDCELKKYDEVGKE